jgi:putative ABC transport system ATP-binding protein
MPSNPLISFRNVSHSFGEGPLRKEVLHELTADFFPGEIVILTGPSGSGKTTALTLAGGLRSVQTGSVRIFAEELQNASSETLVRVRRRIGFIFQAHNLLASLTAAQNVQMALALHGSFPPMAARERTVSILTAVGLAEHIDKYPAQLSIGQKQRVAIARALVGRPEIILADEPTASLDKKSGREVVQLLHDLARKQGCAILLVTHDNRILDIADRMMTLEDGRLSSFTKGLAANAGQMLNSLALLNRRGDLIRHMEHLSDEQFLSLMQKSTRELEQLLRVIDLAQRQVSESMLEQVLEAATLKIGQLLQAERGTIFLVDEENGLLASKVAQHDGSQPLEIVIPMTQGIAGHVARTAETLNIPDAYQHPLFSDKTDKATGYRTRSILCLPIYNRGGKVFAVAQLLNRKDGQPFDARDEQRFREFVPSIAVILESCSRNLVTDKRRRDKKNPPSATPGSDL